MTESTAYDPYELPAEAIEEPPVTWGAALRRIGPGIILAGMIVGSGELILTTSLGAQYGFAYLWLILFSCVVKVFVQIELGRYAISSGLPTLGALDRLGGPRLGNNWLVWWWLVMMLATVSQLGAMTGSTGQALHRACPAVSNAVESALPSTTSAQGVAQPPEWWRPEIPWALVVCAAAVMLLLSGGYRRIELLTTVLVAGVTFLTVTGVIALPFSGVAIPWDGVLAGLVPSIPDGNVAAAFGVFGITGVGATELYAYPYWCLEKGYARAAGRCDNSEAWARRARGWIRVMQLDAWCSMVVFTVSTIAFYAMGAAILHPAGKDAKGSAMITTLAHMYVAPFGGWAEPVFLVGAGFVLFKTLYAASASHSRLTADFLGLGGFARLTVAADRERWVRFFCVFYPLLALALFLAYQEPRAMVVFGGVAQALTLPIISGCSLYFRHRQLDSRLRPSWISDVCLWVATLLITVVAVYGGYNVIRKEFFS